MNPLPLLMREFHVALRRPLTRHLRLVFGGGSMLLTLWAILVSPSYSGAGIFQVLIGIGAVLCMVVAIFGASDSISRERREGTLGFLFLTHLRALDVVFGKIAAAGLVPFYTLLGMFPAFAVCVLVGGVAPGVFWRTMLALIVTLAFSLCSTLFISSLCEDHRKAFGGAALLLIAANPLWLCLSAMRTGPAGVLGFLFLFGGFLALSSLCLYGAAARLARQWRDPEKPVTDRIKNDPVVPSGAHSPGLIEKVPIAWMMLRRRRPARRLGWILCGVALLALLRFAAVPPGALQLKRGLWMLFGLHFAHQVLLLLRTSYAFYWDRQTGALELFAGSRLANEEIFAGFNSFLWRASAPALLVFCLVDLVYAALLWRAGAGPVMVLPLAMGTAQAVTLAAVGWLGVYRSLMMNHPSLAMLATYARLSLLPLVLSLLFLSVPRTDIFKVAAFYLGSTAFIAAFFAMDAKQALLSHGRTLLLRPASEKPPHIESEWSFIDWEQAPVPGALAE